MAKLGYFEADVNWLEMVEEMAADNGHEVVSKAHRWLDALVVINGLNEGDIDAAIVGSRLNGPKALNGDGAEITQTLHERLSGLVVISLTGDPEGVPGADFDVQKMPMDGEYVDPMERIATILGGLGVAE